ncbi:MAG: transposase [Blastochloris sp.]|nr:transposase [Blastochloris sp.]
MEAKGFERVVADKAYEGNAIRKLIATKAKEAVIPSKSNRLEPVPLRRKIYRKRNEVERLINKMKNFRRFTTRYDKLARCYMATTQLIAAFLTINKFVKRSQLFLKTF